MLEDFGMFEKIVYKLFHNYSLCGLIKNYQVEKIELKNTMQTKAQDPSSNIFIRGKCSNCQDSDKAKGKSRFSECFFIIWFLQSAKLHKTRIGHSCWFMKEFCGYVMVSMRLFGMCLVRKLFADVVSHYLSMKVYPKSTEPWK